MGNSKSKSNHDNYHTHSKPKEFQNYNTKENNAFVFVANRESLINTSKIDNLSGYKHGVYKTDSKEKLQDLFHKFDNNLAHNLTINIQPVFIKKIYNKEKFDDKNRTIYVENKSAINPPIAPSMHLTAPSIISTKDDFMTMWFPWKKEFLAYMKSIDPVEDNKQKWSIMLLNRMGPIGQEICRSFTFDEDHTKEDIDILLKKFDFYCIFEGRNREYEEDIDKYVNNLTVIISKYMTNTDEVVKKKIWMDVDKGRFTKKAESLILGFSLPLSIQLLTVKEMTYIWMSYENVNFKRREKIHDFLVKDCNNCGRTHQINNCYARQKKCNKCDNVGHYFSRCPSQLIINCVYCGEDHFARECPAYLNLCNRCNRPNHFSWKCAVPKLLNCKFCGLTHIALKSKCPAINTICTNRKCHRKGHFESKCHKK